MYAIHLVHSMIKPSDKVLDVGGAAQPFKRANAVIDIVAYEKRTTENPILKDVKESYTKETWTVQDICNNSKTFPYKNNEFDFVICGHILEDIRDPIYVVREMSRVGKAGYIEVPSRFSEQLMGLEIDDMVGYDHHRWIIDTSGSGRSRTLKFYFKNHKIHFDKKLHIEKPRRAKNFPYLNQNHDVLGVFWKGSIMAEEDYSVTVADDVSFFQETVQLAQEIGDDLWDMQSPFPVETSINTLKNGITLLSELPVTKSVLLYDKKRQLTQEIINYEKEIVKR